MATNANKPATEEVKKEKMVKVYVPKTKEQKDDDYVSVNNRTWQIMRGVEVEVPDFVAAQFIHEQKMLEKAMAFQEEATKPKNH